MTDVVLVAGAGGVGKTTLSGALAAAAAVAGRATLVLTVDPARRLAQALGLEALGRDPHPVPGHPGLHAAMLDSASSWDRLVHRHTDQEAADRIVASRFFRAIAERFPAGQAYAVAEEVAHLVEDGAYDTIVVDTPPIGGGADFFAAPARIRSLVAGRALRILTGPNLPGRRTVYRLTGRPALMVADRILGGPLLADLADFLIDLRSAYDGIRERAIEVQELLDSSALVVATAPEVSSIGVATDLLHSRGDQTAGLVVNRVLPAAWADAPPGDGDPVAANLAAWGAEARRQHRLLEGLYEGRIRRVPLVVPEPASVSDLADLAAAADLGSLLS
jgi:anion-transporting  ArsA/GET3 family ATPase